MFKKKKSEDGEILTGEAELAADETETELPVDEATKTIDTLQFQGTDMNEIVDVLPEQEATVPADLIII